MYLVSLFEQEAIVEASLGGRVTADEIRVFGEELSELLETFEGRTYSMLLDFSKAKRLDSEAIVALAEVKDQCFEVGANEIVSVTVDEHDAVTHQSLRLQQVLEGRERFVADPSEAQLEKSKAHRIRLAA